MADFVEEAKPKLIIREVTEAQYNHGFSRGEKSRCTTRTAPRRCTQKNYDNAHFGAQCAQAWDEICEVFGLREYPHFREARAKSGRAPGAARHTARLNFGLPQPRRESTKF